MSLAGCTPCAQACPPEPLLRPMHTHTTFLILPSPPTPHLPVIRPTPLRPSSRNSTHHGQTAETRDTYSLPVLEHGGPWSRCRQVCLSPWLTDSHLCTCPCVPPTPSVPLQGPLLTTPLDRGPAQTASLHPNYPLKAPSPRTSTLGLGPHCKTGGAPVHPAAWPHLGPCPSSPSGAHPLQAPCPQVPMGTVSTSTWYCTTCSRAEVLPVPQVPTGTPPGPLQARTTWAQHRGGPTGLGIQCSQGASRASGVLDGNFQSPVWTNVTSQAQGEPASNLEFLDDLQVCTRTCNTQSTSPQPAAPCF